MAVPGVDLALLRTRPNYQDWHMAVSRPMTVFTATVDGDHAETATVITYTNGSVIQTPAEHYTCMFGTTAGGSDVGIVRYKTHDATTITISSNGMELLDGYHITVKREVRPLSVLPNVAGTLEDETKAYTDQNSLMHPLARIGPPACGYLSEGNELPVDFWSDDVAMAGTLSSYLWNFANGTPNTSTQAGTEESPIEVMYSTASGHQGHWAGHQVTDSNGKTHVRYTNVFVFDENTPAITAFDVSGLSGDRNSGGWRASIVVREDADIEHFPEYAQVVIFNKQYWGTTQQNIGYDWTGRENILFVGYIVRDTVVKEPETGYVTFEVASVVEIMKELTAWGASFKSTAGGWHDIPNMTLNKEAFHVFTEHSTIDHIADIYLNLDDIDMRYTDLTEGKLYEQIKIGIGEAGRALLLNNKVGQIYLEPDVQLKLVADRATIDKMFTMDHDDWRDSLSLGEERSLKDACQVDFIGFYYDDDGNAKALGSLAPGRQFESGVVQKITGVRVDTQAEANNYAGVFGGELNNEFKNVTIPMSGFWPVMDIAPQRFVQITLVAGDTLRELVWTEEDCIPQSVSFAINNEHGYCLTDLIVQRENTPIGALTNEIPEVVVPKPPNPPAPPAPPTIPEESDWGVVIFAHHVVAICKDFFATEEDQHWADITPTDLNVNQDNPGASVDEIYALSINENTGEAFLSTSKGVFHTANINNTPVSWIIIIDEKRVGTFFDGGRFGAVKTHGGRVVINYVHRVNWSSVYYIGTAASLAGQVISISLMRESYDDETYKAKDAATQNAARVTGYNIGYARGKFYIGAGRYRNASTINAMTRRGLFDITNQLNPDHLYDGAHTVQIGAITSNYVQDYLGNIYSINTGKTKSQATPVIAALTGGIPTYGMDEITEGYIYLLFTDGAGKLWRGRMSPGLPAATELADNKTLFGVGSAEPFRALFTRDNYNEIVCVNSEEMDFGESKAIVVWTDNGFVGSPTHYDKTGDYITAVGNWGGGNTNRGNAGVQLYKIYKYT